MWRDFDWKIICKIGYLIFFFFLQKLLLLACVPYVAGDSGDYDSEVGDLQKEANDAENGEQLLGTKTDENEEPIPSMQP